MIDGANTRGQIPEDRPYVPSPRCPKPFPNPSRPQLLLPRNSCDSHCHVFGPSQRYPYAVDRTFTPRDSPKEQIFALWERLGIERGVVVQSACYGNDHSVLLDALNSAPERLRGVGIVDASMPESELRRLDSAGVRGFRLNFLPHLGSGPSHSDLRTVADRCGQMGWHAEVHTEGVGILKRRDFVASLNVPVVIDHMARVDLREGPSSPSVRCLLELLDTGRVWVKISGIDRVSTVPGFHDGLMLAALLVSHAPERVLWGTDYPHVNIDGDAPNDGLLVDLLTQIAPRQSLRKVLVDNPAELFGFPPSH